MDGVGNVYVAGGQTDNAFKITLEPAICELCGNGVLDLGEACDDGNTNDGDCCSAACTYEAAFLSCGSGTLCDPAGVCDGSGVCVGGGPVDCDDADICTADSCDPGTGTCDNNTIGSCSETTDTVGIPPGSNVSDSVLGGSSVAGGVDATFTSTGGGNLDAKLVEGSVANLSGNELGRDSSSQELADSMVAKIVDVEAVELGGELL